MLYRNMKLFDVAKTVVRPARFCFIMHGILAEYQTADTLSGLVLASVNTTIYDLICTVCLVKHTPVQLI